MRAWAAALAGTLAPFAVPSAKTTDAIVIGAGIAGLSCALEAARSGATVLVIDMSTVGGGHAILSNGAVCLIGTPLQASSGVADSPELARADFVARGEDADPGWVAAYVERSKTEIYDWLTEAGVIFDGLAKPPGNSVARLHLARGKGWGLVGPLLRECFRRPNITFLWASRAEKLIVERGAVTGVAVANLRTGARRDWRAPVVVVATGASRTIWKWCASTGLPNSLPPVACSSAPPTPPPVRVTSWSRGSAGAWVA